MKNDLIFFFFGLFNINNCIIYFLNILKLEISISDFKFSFIPSFFFSSGVIIGSGNKFY